MTTIQTKKKKGKRNPGKTTSSVEPPKIHDRFRYGRGSNRRMEGVNSYLILTARLALRLSNNLDWGVGPYGGKRSVPQQYSMYKKGYSRCDGTRKKSYHQSGNALDLVPYKNGAYTWADILDFFEIKKYMFQAWNMLKKEGKIPSNLHIHWGGYWSAKDRNADGKMQKNERGWDLPHFEVRSFKQRVVFRKDLLAN